MGNAAEPEFVSPRILHNGPIALAEPDPRWPAQFTLVASRILGALGPSVILLEHAGSTSVPGLPAKPVLDVVLVVADPADEVKYVQPLGDVGFALHLREPGWYEHRLLRGTDPLVNLHVFGPEAPEVGRMLLFRDWLRDHPGERDLYATVKRELAARQWTYVQDYADAKSLVVQQILERAAGSEPPTTSQ